VRAGEAAERRAEVYVGMNVQATILAMLNELWFCDPTTHIFYEVLEQKKVTDPRTVGIYRQRLDASNLKLRFAVQALREVTAVVKELEHGEFIYFDDANRLKAHFGLETFVVFLRAALDMAIGGYAVYFSGNTDIDSINDVFKKWPPSWISERNRVAWESIKAAYDRETFTWIHSLVGRDRGMSLRDLAVHKGIVSIDTVINDAGRGRFVITLDKETLAPANPWLEAVFRHVHQFILALRAQIRDAETSTAPEA
jgi:hypothetical protein